MRKCDISKRMRGENELLFDRKRICTLARKLKYVKVKHSVSHTTLHRRNMHLADLETMHYNVAEFIARCCILPYRNILCSFYSSIHIDGHVRGHNHKGLVAQIVFLKTGKEILMPDAGFIYQILVQIL